MPIEIRDDMLTCAINRATAETLLKSLQGEWTQADFERLIRLFDTQRRFNRLMTQASIGIWPVSIETGLINIGNPPDGFMELMRLMWASASR